MNTLKNEIETLKKKLEQKIGREKAEEWAEGYLGDPDIFEKYEREVGFEELDEEDLKGYVLYLQGCLG